MIQISSFSELIAFIEANDLTKDKINALLQGTLGIYHIEATNKKQLIEKLKRYWQEYKGTKERPLFID